MNVKPDAPIGIFDSGVGGLTVANAIKTVLPNEDMIYFGDTFHLPYGDKSTESIIYYSIKIADFLLEKQCKIILIACNSASAVAYEEVKQHVQNKAIVLNVIDPVVEYVNAQKKYTKIGVIGTKATINSSTYEKKIKKNNPDISIKSVATPLLVPLIEEGFIFDDISNAVIRAYLSDKNISDIQAIILGCTHYPIIKNQIHKYYNFEIDIIDSAQIMANTLLDILKNKKLHNTSQNRTGNRFFVSDYTEYFEKISKLFFGADLQLQKINFWK